MLGWFQALMPKEMRFFELFVRHATVVVAGAEALRGLLQGGDKIEYYSKVIFEREAEAEVIAGRRLIDRVPVCLEPAFGMLLKEYVGQLQAATAHRAAVEAKIMESAAADADSHASALALVEETRQALGRLPRLARS